VAVVGFDVKLGRELGTVDGCELGTNDGKLLCNTLGVNDGNALGDENGNEDGRALGLLFGKPEGAHDGIGGQSQFNGIQESHVSLHVAATPSIAHSSMVIAEQNLNLFSPSTKYFKSSSESEHLSSTQLAHVIGQWTLTPGNAQRSAMRHSFAPTHVQTLPILFSSISSPSYVLNLKGLSRH